MSDEAKHHYPEIDRLLLTLQRHAVSIKIIPAEKPLLDHSWTRLSISIDKKHFDLPVEDEFGDVIPEAHPAMLLHIALWTCEGYMEAEDYLTWCTENGWEAGDPIAREIYFELRAIVPHFLEIIGDDAAALSAWDYTLNTGVTQTLRAMKNPEL